jgi:hypothetical protein
MSHGAICLLIFLGYIHSVAMLCISWKVYWEVVMAELFSWLSETPIATNIVMIAFVVLIIAFVLAVVITVIACIRGQPISIGGLRFGPEPRPWMVQDGAENIPAEYSKKREFVEGTFEGRKTILVPVTFDPPFKKLPRVVGFSSILLELDS